MPVSKIVSPIITSRLTRLHNTGNTANSLKILSPSNLDELNVIRNTPNSNWIKEQIQSLLSKLQSNKERFTLVNGKTPLV